jgi:hypothetical protein
VIVVSTHPTEFESADVRFEGRSGAARFAKDGTVRLLAAEGTTRFVVQGMVVEGSGPYRATLKDGKVATTPLADGAKVNATPAGKQP